MRMCVGSLFWNKHLWEQGVHKAFAKPFHDLDKVAAPDKRWLSILAIKYNEPPREDGTKLGISIAGTTTEKRALFVKELLGTIRRWRNNRPFFEKSPNGSPKKWRTKDDFHYDYWDD